MVNWKVRTKCRTNHAMECANTLPNESPNKMSRCNLARPRRNAECNLFRPRRNAEIYFGHGVIMLLTIYRKTMFTKRNVNVLTKINISKTYECLYQNQYVEKKIMNVLTKIIMFKIKMRMPLLKSIFFKRFRIKSKEAFNNSIVLLTKTNTL